MRYLLLTLALATTLLFAQQKGQDKGKQTPPDDDSAGLFKNKSGYKSSKQSSDSTTLGFNGVDPSGKLNQDVLAKDASAADSAAVARMASRRPNAAALKQFVKAGGLN